MMDRAIATASDAKYFVGLRTMLHSLRVHAPALPVFIFDCGLSAQQLEYLRSEGYQIVVPQGLDGPEWGHVTRATYARFSSCFLPARKILYLDADVVIVGFLDELFEYDCPLGVCREDGMPMWTHFHGSAALEYYGISRDSQVFNGGVFLLDVHYWGTRFHQEYLEKISKWGHECKFADQSCLNLIAYEKGEFMFIPKKWNTFPYELEKYPDFRIVHFHMSKKPWHDHFEHQDALQLWKMYM
jgi:lipopolysaccharide biosynthesis glycosyltransferase